MLKHCNRSEKGAQLTKTQGKVQRCSFGLQMFRAQICSVDVSNIFYFVSASGGGGREEGGGVQAGGGVTVFLTTRGWGYPRRGGGRVGDRGGDSVCWEGGEGC